ncbi:MAG: hypothetical protein JWQ87_902 [Candidatus Sulfotelmatobacter sp.]|nr:hypothetical protein [Candidatus Sulfotelmatobacter sp.]
MIVGDARGLPLNVLHQSIKVVVRIRNAHHTNGGPIPKVAGLEFGDRNVEAGAQPVFQTSYDLPFILKRLCRFNVEFEGEKGNHAVISG